MLIYIPEALQWSARFQEFLRFITVHLKLLRTKDCIFGADTCCCVLLANDEWQEELDPAYLTTDRQFQTSRDAECEGWQTSVVLEMGRILH